MISLLEVADRMRQGPKMDEMEWNMHLFKSMQKLVEDYGLKDLGPEALLEIDPDYADTAFQAAVHYLVEIGMFTIPVNRVIRFTEDEVKEAVRSAPVEVVVGTGRDARVIRKREIEDRRPCNIEAGLHSPYTEDVLSLVPKNWAMIPQMDALEGFNTYTTDGWELYTTPFEAYAARREVAWMREGVRKAGRPGMAIVYYPVNTTASTMIAPLDPEHGLRRTDGALMKPLPDMKVEVNMVTAAIVYEDYGAYVYTGGASEWGGFLGGPAGGVVGGIVRMLAGRLIYHGCMGNHGCDRMPTGAHVTKLGLELSWPKAAVNLALCRNINMPRYSHGSGVRWNGGAWGMGTDMWLRGLALHAMVATVLGANIGICRVSRPQPNEGGTPLDVEWQIEVSDATIRAGMKLEDVTEVMVAMDKKVEGKTLPPTGYRKKTIQECYDLVKHRPSREHQEIYENLKKEFSDLGLKFE